MDAMRRELFILIFRTDVLYLRVKEDVLGELDRLSYSHTVQPEPWMSQNDFTVPQYVNTSPSQDIKMLEPYDPAVLPLRICPE